MEPGISPFFMPNHTNFWDTLFSDPVLLRQSINAEGIIHQKITFNRKYSGNAGNTPIETPEISLPVMCGSKSLKGREASR